MGGGGTCTEEFIRAVLDAVLTTVEAVLDIDLY